MMNRRIIGYTSAVISTMLLGSVGVFVRNISADVYTITFSRVGIGLLFLVLFLIYRNELKSVRTIKLSFSILATGVLLSLAILCYTNAIKTTTLANAAFILYLAPVMAVGVAAVFLKEKFTFLNGVFISLAFLGLLFVLEFKILFDLEESEGYLWGVGASLCYVFFIVFNRNIPESVPALTRSFYQFLLAAIVMLPFLDNAIFNLTVSDYYWLLAVGLFQGFLATTLLVTAIKYLKTIEYGTISYIEPLVASIIGFMLYSEQLSSLQFIGYAIVLSVGVLQIVSTKKRSNIA